MQIENYASYWNDQASTEAGAVAAVDNSGSEATVRKTGQWTARQVRTALQLDGTQRVLELGCGVARIGRELVADCARWDGADISRAMLDVAAQRLASHDTVGLTQLTRTSLDMFAEATFDAAYSVAVLCHMDKEDLYLYLQELQRVLKPGALAYVETWNLAHPVGWRRWEFEVRHWQRSNQSKRKPVGRNQFCAPQEFSLYLEHAGLTPLAQYADSPWIQVVVAKDLSETEQQRQRQRLTQVEDTVAYSRQWGELFSEIIDVIYGLAHPAQMLAALDARPPDSEVALFRDHLLAMWRSGEQHWGAPPES